MILHTLNARPDSDSFHDCLRSAGTGDTILLLGDGVYCGLTGSAARQAMRDCPARLVALDTDTTAAGVRGRIGDIPLIDMDAFVALSEYYPRQLAWY
ncbi:MAG: sulfurtransferase complex subunit TusB [Halioglobus sp.]